MDLGPLRDSREFRLLWIGQLISMTGRQVTVVAIPYQIYVLTGSTLAVGLLGLVQAVPLVLAGLYAGALADRFDRRLVMLGSLSVLGLTSLALALAAGGRPSLWFIYAVSAVSAGVSTAEHSARSTPLLALPRSGATGTPYSASSALESASDRVRVTAPLLRDRNARRKSSPGAPRSGVWTGCLCRHGRAAAGSRASGRSRWRRCRGGSSITTART